VTTRVAVLRRQTTRIRGVAMETVALVSRQTTHVMTSRSFVVSRLGWWCRRYDSSRVRRRMWWRHSL